MYNKNNYNRYDVQNLQWDIAEYLRTLEADSSGIFEKRYLSQLRNRAKVNGYITIEDISEIATTDGEMFAEIMEDNFGELYNEALQEAVLDFINDSETIDSLGDGELALKESVHRPARPIRRKDR